MYVQTVRTYIFYILNANNIELSGNTIIKLSIYRYYKVYKTQFLNDKMATDNSIILNTL